MAWVYLILASAFEVAWAIGLKSTHGFTRLWPSMYVLATGTASVILLAQATKQLPIGTAYAVWTGGDRGDWNGGAGDDSVRRIARRGAANVHCVDCGGSGWVEDRVGAVKQRSEKD